MTRVYRKRNDHTLPSTPSTPIGFTWCSDTYSHLLALRLPAVVLLLASTRLAGITRQSLWFDEGYTLSLAESQNIYGFFHAFARLTTSEHLQPLYYCCIFLWSRVGGTADVALRLPSAVFSIISGIIIYNFAARRVVCFTTTVIFPMLAVSCYALSSFAFYYAQEARPYALVQMISFLVLALWIDSRDREPRCSLLFIVACLVASVASPFAALLVLTLSFTDLLLSRKLWLQRWRWPILLIGVVLAVYLLIGRALHPSFVARDVVMIRQPLWMNAGYLFYGILFGTTLGPATSALRGADKFHAFMSHWPIVTACVISMITFSMGTWRCRRCFRRGCVSRDLLFASVFYTILLLFVFGFCGHLNILPRHASPLFAIIFLLCTSSISGVIQSRQSSRSGQIYVVTGLLGLVALNSLSIKNYWDDPSFRKDDYRATADLLRQGNGPYSGPKVLVAGDASLFEHYGVSLVDLSGVDPAGLAESVENASLYAPEVTVVVNERRNYRWDHIAGPTQMLQPVYRCTSREHLAYMEVLGCRLDKVDRPLSAVTETETAGGPYAR